MSERIQYETRGPIGWLTLSDPDRHNTLTADIMDALTTKLRDIAEARSVAVVVLQGLANVFSSGHNLREIQERDLHGVHALFEQSYRLKRTMREMPQVIIAKVQGIAVAAGLELVAAADLAVAAESARFGTTGIRWGLFCSTPGVFLSRNVPRKKAAELLFTGRLYSAKEAEAMGLVNLAVPDDQLDQATESLAREIAAHSLNVIEIGKRLFYEQLPQDDWSALALATEVIVRNSKHPDAMHGIQSFLEKRPPRWEDGIERG
ncbi:MAG: enoyl-CoA hydratase/isomerase family protein [Hydrogenibacillus sp.]|nr:enoyl-CoA hydratase/isomerase family protein [Hydrogenibacillus sp.]